MKSGKVKGKTMKVRRLIFTIVGIALLVTLITPATVFADNEERPYLVGTFVGEDGQQIDKIIVPGRPPEIKAEAVMVPEPNIALGIGVLTNVPAYDWSYGCSATSGAMMAGYYDNNGYPDMYTGPANDGDAPMDNSIWGPGIGGSDGECPLSATHNGIDGRTTRGHVDDYWIDYLDPGPDPFITGSWTEHAYGDCTGDYMKTSQSTYGNVDGSTIFYFFKNGAPIHDYNLEALNVHNYDGGYGLHLFFESRGYAVAGMYNQYISAPGPTNTNGFTFAQYKQEIDAGRPVLIQVEGHTMLGYGYGDATNTVYLHDTWDYAGHEMIWGGSYSGMKHYGVTVIQLQSLPAVITSCDASGNEKNQFATNQSVYVTGSGLEPNTNYSIWIQNNSVNVSDALIPDEDPSEARENVTTGPDNGNSLGGFPATEIWAIPESEPVTHYPYDIVVDKEGDGEGTYNSADDGIDSAATVVGFVAPVPELPTIILLSIGLLVLVGYIQLRRKNRQE